MLRVFSDPRCLAHVSPYGFPERPERVPAILDRLRQEGFDVRDGVRREDALESLPAVHSESYLERFRRAVDRGDGLLDSADNPLSRGSWDASLAAVEVVLEATDWLAEGEGRKAFAAVRPPGHHAERAVAMGFCYFNNVAVAAERLLGAHGAGRVAIFDFDVHHGNGTQHIFEERADVFYASVHQYPFYPGTGASGERGRGEGDGTTLNAPLPAGSDDDTYADVLLRLVLPELRRFGPEVLLVSAGFDAWRRDPLGGMAVSETAFGDWGRWLAELAEETTKGRVLATLEGGYDLLALPGLVSTHLEGLAGRGPAGDSSGADGATARD